MSSTLFVKGFSLITTEEDLSSLFSPFGIIQEIKISKDFTTRVSRGEGFVHYLDHVDAERATQVLQGATLNGNLISVGPVLKPKNIVIIGGGLAGLSAAIECALTGSEEVNVLIIEKEKGLYGNSAKASSGINVVEKDDFETFVRDTLESGKGKSDPKLVDYLGKESMKAYDFLVQMGADLSAITQCGGHSYPRTRRNTPSEKPLNVGWHLMSLLNAKVKEIQNIRTITNCKVININMKGTIVCGVEMELTTEQGVHDISLQCDSVIVTTGGFSASKEFLSEFRPDIQTLATTNGSFATGDGIKLCRAIGAHIVNLEDIQIHPTGFVNPSDPENQTKFLAPEALRAYGGILINANGERFVNELTTRDAATQSILENGFQMGSQTCAFLLMNSFVFENFGGSTFQFYMSKGLIKQYRNVAEFASEHNLNYETIVEEINSYNISDKYGKSNIPTTFDLDAIIYTAIVTPSIHYTMGGVSINKYSQVINSKTMTAIPGLYAAGEVTGGVHGSNRLAGNSLLECVVFGRLAGRQAAQYYPTLWALNKDEFVPLNLSDKIPLSPSITLYRFALPSGHSSGLNTGQYIALRAFIDNEEVVRYYSPVSRTNEVETLDLLIKMNAGGNMTEYLDSLQIGEPIEVKGPISGLELDVGTVPKIGMLAGGTGIAPMIQLIRAHILYERKTGVQIQMSLLFGAKNEEELVLRELLEAHQQKHSNIDIYYTLQEPPLDWTMGVGFITDQMIKEHCPSPEEEGMIVICGPPIFCKVMKGILEKMGYSPDQYFSYL